MRKALSVMQIAMTTEDGGLIKEFMGFITTHYTVKMKQVFRSIRLRITWQAVSNRFKIHATLANTLCEYEKL